MLSILNPDPRDFIEAHMIVSPIVKAGGARRLMHRDLLGDRELTAILRVGGDASSTESVIPDLCLDASVARPTADHPVGVPLAHRPGGQGDGLARLGAEEHRAAVYRKTILNCRRVGFTGLPGIAQLNRCFS